MKRRRRGINRMKMVEMATAAGQRAFLRGMPVRKNPFMEKTLFWLCWRDGYETERGRRDEAVAA